MEYVVCTNSTNAKGSTGTAVSTSSASVVPPAASSDDYRPSVSSVATPVVTAASTAGGGTPSGLDYSIGRTSANDVYSSHLSAAAAAAAAASAPSYSNYDTSPAGYPGTNRAASVGGKTSAGTPTPPQSAWNASEGYHYSNLSPSRSPGGYPRTASVASTVSPAAAVSSMWQHWQQGNGQELHHQGHQPPPPGPPAPHQAHHVGQHASELGDMLSMLGQNAGHHPSAVAGFASAAENLGAAGMFTGQFQ